jgi:hypothetical protein
MTATHFLGRECKEETKPFSGKKRGFIGKFEGAAGTKGMPMAW